MWQLSTKLKLCGAAVPSLQCGLLFFLGVRHGAEQAPLACMPHSAEKRPGCNHALADLELRGSWLPSCSDAQVHCCYMHSAACDPSYCTRCEGQESVCTCAVSHLPRPPCALPSLPRCTKVPAPLGAAPHKTVLGYISAPEKKKVWKGHGVCACPGCPPLQPASPT